MPAKTVFVAVCFFFLVVAQWQGVAPMPQRLSNGGSAVLDNDKILFSSAGYAFIYDARADAWTIQSPRPGAGSYLSVVRKGWENKALVFIGFPVISDTHEYDADTGTWLARAPYPFPNHAAASATDDNAFVYSFGGRTSGSGSSGTADSFVYRIALDVWAALTPMPTVRGDVGGGYSDGKAFVLGGLTSQHGFTLEVYSVDADTWTTGTSPPVSHSRLNSQGLPSIGNELFAVGSSQPAESNKVHRYSVGSDAWTSLLSTPVSVNYGFAVTWGPGDLLTSSNSDESFYKLATGFTFAGAVPPAQVVGDPVFTSFHGVAQHLDLAPGVFNILNTRHAVINALINVVDGMPPEENMGLLAVGIVVRTCEQIFTVDCSVCLSDGRMLCGIKKRALIRGMGAMPGCQDISYQIDAKNLTVVADGVQVTVWSSDLSFTTVVADVVTNFPSSHFLNLDVQPLGGTPVSSFGGILGDLTNLDKEHLYQNLSIQAYTVPSGCLFDTDARSSAGLFAQAASVAALACK